MWPACCFGGGFLVSAFGVYIHNLWVVYLGYGVLGGCGLGLGYISPVSTLIKWFPDRPGMATGMAIMGFGGAAFIASPLSVWLMAKFSTPTHVGVAETFITLGIVYFIFMMVGAFIVRVPAPGWKPEGYTPPVVEQKLITKNDVYVYDAIKTPQFWLIWWVLCLNVTAGIGVLGQASAMTQEMFPGKVSVVAAAGFVGLLSLFNMARPLLLGLDLGLYRPQEHLFLLLRDRNGALLRGALGRLDRQRLAVRAVLRHHHEHVWRRFRHRTGLSERHVRHALCRRHSWLADHGVVGGRRVRPGAGELHPPVSDRQWRAESAGLQCHHVHHGGLVGHRLHLQPHDQGRSCAATI